MADLNRLQVDAYVDETDIGKVKLGQSVQITVDASPKKIFAGKVLIDGVIGIGIGIGSAVFMARLSGWNTIVSASSLIAALAVSASIGIFFGIFPASKAGALHPIEALRYE